MTGSGADPGATFRRRSPWVYVGIGCVVVAGIAIVAAATLGFVVYRTAAQAKKDAKDPQMRNATVQRILGCPTIPAGYHAALGFSIPFLTQVALLSDHEPDAEGRPSPAMERGFFYVESFGRQGRSKELRDYFEGRSDDPRALRRGGLHVRDAEILSRGVITGPGQTVLYVAQRGSVRFWRPEVRSGSNVHGVMSLLLVECPQDHRPRFGAWFGPDPDPEKPSSSVDFRGTPADEAALREFMGNFALCGGSPAPRPGGNGETVSDPR